jgi:hypothetical protein
LPVLGIFIGPVTFVPSNSTWKVPPAPALPTSAISV